jgi:Lysylphosphatidylglycerol synthase TM region
VIKLQSLTRISLRVFAGLLGPGLLAYLVFRAGPVFVWEQVQVVGWGFALIVILGGLSQLVRTCAWRQTITYDIPGLRWSRSIGAQLASNACGQLGFAGKLLGEGLRVSLLSPVVPVDRGISSCAIDGGLHLLTAAIVAVLGISITLLHFPLSGHWRVYASVLSAVLIAVVVMAVVAVGSGWQLMGGVARAIGQLPQLHNWVIGKQPTIDSAEHNLLTFRRVAPAAFWASLMFSLLWHALAVLEVYVILRFMGARAAFVGAFALEGLTKVINLVGAVNPGNFGTYEGGNMLVANLFGVTATAGLTLALCRRAGAIFWAGVGALCMIAMKGADWSNADEWGKAESR